MDLASFFLNENKFSRIMRYLTGQRDMGKGIGILTAENHGGLRSSPTANNRSMQHLYTDLMQNQFQFWKQSGSYGGLAEKSVVVVNISRSETVKLGKKYRQESVIHLVQDGKTVFAALIDAETGLSIVATTKLEITSVQDAEDMFSRISGRKYRFGFNFG